MRRSRGEKLAAKFRLEVTRSVATSLFSRRHLNVNRIRTIKSNFVEFTRLKKEYFGYTFVFLRIENVLVTIFLLLDFQTEQVFYSKQ